ncbi:MAG: hypothetical protein ACXWV5_05310 [Flavitalea sp.]
MKAIKNLKSRVSALILTMVTMFYSNLSMAQEKIDIDINAGKSEDWYASPWVWVVGAAVFILLLVAILRGGNRRTDV